MILLTTSCLGKTPKTANDYPCIMPSCLDDILAKGLRPVQCVDGLCGKEELLKVVLNMADMRSCLKQVSLAMQACR